MRPGVGAVVFAPDGRVFMGRRADTAADAWQFPQGGIERGESPRRAALREVAEEMGTDRVVLLGECADWLTYDLPAASADRLWRGRYRGQRQRWFAFRFTGRDADIRLDAHPPAEFDAWRWVPLAAAADLVVGFKRPVYARLVAAFSRFAAEPAAAATTPAFSGARSSPP